MRARSLARLAICISEGSGLMSNPPLDIVPPLGYLLNNAPGSPMSPPRGPMGGGAFIVALRGTVYVLRLAHTSP